MTCFGTKDERQTMGSRLTRIPRAPLNVCSFFNFPHLCDSSDQICPRFLIIPRMLAALKTAAARSSQTR